MRFLILSVIAMSISSISQAEDATVSELVVVASKPVISCVSQQALRMADGKDFIISDYSPVGANNIHLRPDPNNPNVRFGSVVFTNVGTRDLNIFDRKIIERNFGTEETIEATITQTKINDGYYYVVQFSGQRKARFEGTTTNRKVFSAEIKKFNTVQNAGATERVICK